MRADGAGKNGSEIFMNSLVWRPWLRAISLLVMLSALPSVMPSKSNRLLRLPVMQAGQKFVYRVRCQIKKATRAESRIATPTIPEGHDSDT